MTLVTALPRTLVLPHQVIIKQAHPTNYWSSTKPAGGGYRKRTKASALVFHTSEEKADGIESTPLYFAKEHPEHQASTDSYADNDGDLWVMMSDEDCPFANGVSSTSGRVIWKGTKGARPPWYEPGISYNCYTRSIEEEGYASSIHLTMTPAQFETTVDWALFWTVKDKVLLDRNHFVGHYEIDSWKTDPGKFPIDDVLAQVKSRLSSLGVSRRMTVGDVIELHKAVIGQPSKAEYKSMEQTEDLQRWMVSIKK